MDCPKCGAYNETEVGSCLSCGAPLAAEDAAAPTMMKPASRAAPAQRLQQSGGPPRQCPNCMTLNAASFKFCARCGTPLTASGAAPPPKVAGWPVARPDAKPAAGAARSPQAAGPAPSGAKPAASRPAAAAGPGTRMPTTPSAPPTPVPAATGKPPVAARPAPPPPPKPGPGTRPPTPAPPPKAGAPRARARISAIARDGSRSADYVLTQPETRVGRAVGDGEVKLDKDQFVAAAHAEFNFDGD